MKVETTKEHHSINNFSTLILPLQTTVSVIISSVFQFQTLFRYWVGPIYNTLEFRVNLIQEPSIGHKDPIVACALHKDPVLIQ